MNAIAFEQFEVEARTHGFDEVLERSWEPNTTLAQHAHPFAVSARVVRVVRGEIWLTVGAKTRHLVAGDTFELARDVPHARRYGEEGASYWVARRNRN